MSNTHNRGTSAPDAPAVPCTWGFMATRVYLMLCVTVNGLIQTQRLAPSFLALPATPWDSLAEPWRLLGTFCYSDGLTIGFVVKLHIISCLSFVLEHLCVATPACLANCSPIPLQGSSLYAVILALGCLLLYMAASARPLELFAPFQLGQVALFLCQVVCSLPHLTVAKLAGAGVPITSWMPLAVVSFTAWTHDGHAALRLFAGLGAGVLFTCLDLIPHLPFPIPKPTVAAGTGASSEPVFRADGHIRGDTSAPRRPLSRRTGTTLGLLGLSALIRAIQLDYTTPYLPAAKVMATHGRALYAAAGVSLAPPPEVGAYFEAVEAATNLSSSMRFQPPSGHSDTNAVASISARPLGALSLLKLYQYAADQWHEKLRNVRSPPSLGSLKVKGGKEMMEVSEDVAQEMERLLSDALSRTDFASSLSDRDVLKSILKTLTPTQACTERSYLRTLLPTPRPRASPAAPRQMYCTALAWVLPSSWLLPCCGQ
jgi:hypothetical protein